VCNQRDWLLDWGVHGGEDTLAYNYLVKEIAGQAKRKVLRCIFRDFRRGLAQNRKFLVSPRNKKYGNYV